MKKLPKNLRRFLEFIYIITIICLIVFLKNTHFDFKSLFHINVLFLIIAVAVTETYTVVFRNVSFSTSFAVELASYVLFGPVVTICVMILGFTLRVLKIDENKYQHIFNTPLFVTIFNYCVLILSLLSGHCFYLILGGTYGYNVINQNNVISIFMFSSAVCIVNNIVISYLVVFLRGRKFGECFKENFSLIVINIFILSPLGIILALVYEKYQFVGMAIVLCPILFSRYAISLCGKANSEFCETIGALMHAMEARDKYTEGHSQRVSELVAKIAREMRYGETDIVYLKIASMLHDVGKMGIDDNILNKPGKLTEEEFNAIKQHPVIGLNILKDIKHLSDAKEIVLHHHERYDGKGYPDGKCAKDLNMDVFIVQLADSVDAMATDRPYRKALTKDDIVEELKRNRGTQFHPKVVDAYLKIMDKEK